MTGERAFLEGAQGPAMRLAMRLVLRAAEVLGARSLIPVSFAHIDSCFYAGKAHVDFAQISGRSWRQACGPGVDQQRRGEPG